jgi:putative ABC transport system permease protein
MRYALESLRRRPGRTALTALGIGLATALVLILLSVSAGIEQSAFRLGTQSGVDLLGASADTTLTSGSFPPVSSAHRLPDEIQRADPNVATASPWLVSSLVFANASLYAAANASASGSAVPAGWAPADATSIGWIPGENGGLDVPPILVGTDLPVAGDPHYANGTYQGPWIGDVVLNGALASLLHLGPNDTVWVSPQSPSGPSQLASWFANATPFRVVGLSGPFWFLPSALLGEFYLSELQQVVGGASAATDYASLVLIHLADPSKAATDQRILTAAFGGMTFFTLTNILGTVENVIGIYRTFGTLVGLIGVVVATLFAATVLLMSVEDRSRELALLRVVGYSRAAIGGFVVEEGVWLALLGLAIGLPMGFVGSYALNRFLEALVPGLPSGFSFVAYNLNVIGQAVAEVLLIGLVAAMIPLGRALQIPVVEELRAA